MLILSCFVATVVICCSVFTSAGHYQESYYGKKDTPPKTHNSLAVLIKTKTLSPYNVPADKDEPTVLYAHMKPNVVSEKKHVKKFPKRTIQRIIKKTRKNRKVYLHQVSNPPMQPTKYEEPTTTTQATRKKKIRKWSSKYANSYRHPFQKIKGKDSKYRRMRRDVNRDLYILEDLDEIEFLSSEDGADTVRAHVKNYW